MMKIRILAVGKLKESFWQEAVAEYVKRLSAYADVEIIEIPDEKAPAEASLKTEAAIRNAEGEKLLSKIKDGDYVIALDLRAEEYTSEALAVRLENWMIRGGSRLTFVIGGSLGLGDAIKEKADERWTLSRLTFTHQMTRVLLLEQLYRAFKINHHETYHK